MTATAAALVLAGTAVVLMGQAAPGSSLLAAADGTGPATTAPATATITISGISGGFTPQVTTVAKGGTVTVTNADPMFSHTFTSNAVDDRGRPLFDVTLGKAGSDTASATVDVSKLGGGTYTFYCRFHPTMTGTLVIDGPPDGDITDAPPFEQPLVQPPRLTGKNLRIVMKQAYVQVFPTGPKTRVLTYGGTFPGPTIVRPTGSDTKVTFVNRLPKYVGAVTIHQHGGHQKSKFDGQPASYVIRHGSSRTYDYPLRDAGRPLPAALRFYHDHRMDRTARNNWYGLTGMFLTTDPHDAKVGLPHGRYDVPLMITDRTFDADNQLIDPWKGQASAASPADSDPMSSAMAGMTDRAGTPSPETTGQQVLVNGRFAPYLDVHPGKYRFQILNASLFSSYTFALSNGQPFTQIGNGGGLIPHPVVRQSIMLGPAQRADVVVDFTGYDDSDVLLSSIPRNDGSTTGIGTRTAALMQFRVDHTAPPAATVPSTLMTLPRLKVPNKAAMTWKFGLTSTATGSFWSINGKRYNPKRVDHKVILGHTEKWVLKNTSDITHYVHLHEELWRTISRDGRRPPPWERGYEDTWQLDPGETVVVAARFTDFTGKFMVHCHMLDHEDDGMMATFQVVKPKRS